MSKEKTEGQSEQDRIGQLEEMALKQGEQLADALQTIKVLQGLLVERLEAKMEPAQALDYNRQMESMHRDWAKRQDEFQEAQKKAAEAGKFKFMVCIFTVAAEHNQAQQIKQLKGASAAPWDCGVLPVHPWRLIGVDAENLEDAALKATAKYNKVQGIRRILDNGLEHTIYQVDEEGKPVNGELYAGLFRRQLSDVPVGGQLVA